MKPKAFLQDLNTARETLQVAQGKQKADLVIKNGQFLDVFTGSFLTGDIAIFGGQIVGTCESYTGRVELDAAGSYIVPGFIDTHVHIESSLMHPVRFQECVLPCGTTTVIWDPHEVANVWGAEGIQWALEASESLQLDVFVMVPSCVPSTTPSLGLESSGAVLNAAALKPFVNHQRVLGLAEMMNFPGLLAGEEDVVQKLLIFERKKRDGHCPNLSGRQLNAYGACGIHSCHESTTLLEAREKMQKGFHVLIREGSCAKNARTLLPLLNEYSSMVLGLCSDDRNPADIAKEGHIDHIIDLALKMGCAPHVIFRAASLSSAQMYGLDDRGAVAPGFKADLCFVRPKQDVWSNGFKVTKVIKGGHVVDPAELRVLSDQTRSTSSQRKNINLHGDRVATSSFHIPAKANVSQQRVRVIEVIPNQILTNNGSATLKVVDGELHPDLDQDILKIGVFERHHRRPQSHVAFVKGFELREGAIATTINHDSHNIIAVGTSDRALTAAVNRLIDIDGGIVVWKNDSEVCELRLPIGGLMTLAAPQEIAKTIESLRHLARAMGCKLDDPFLQLSFLALPVIPELKITDRGLVDVGKFAIVPVSLDP